MSVTNPYFERLSEAVEAAPHLSDILWILCRSCLGKRKIPASVTIADIQPGLFSDLRRLFPSKAILDDRKRGKFVLSTAGLSESGYDLSDWLAAAAEIVGFSVNNTRKRNDEYLRIVTSLRFLFPSLDASVDFLEDSPSEVRRKVTLMGGGDALDFYKNALAAVDFLKANEEILSPSELGARIANDSKVFRSKTSLRKITKKLLAVELGCDKNDAFGICGVAENPTSIFLTVFGPFVYSSNGRTFDWIKRLWENGEPAMLNYANLENIEGIYLDFEDFHHVLLCENESPFNAMMREFSATSLIFTGGYPNTAVRRFLMILSGDFKLSHWGDTDPQGLDIAAILNGIKPLTLFRCDLATCERLKKRLRPLDKKKRARAERILASDNEFPFRRELEFALEHGWLEQEAWTPE